MLFRSAHSIELDPNTTHPVIALMPDQNGIEAVSYTHLDVYKRQKQNNVVIMLIL